jgi:hypothetical protein
MDFPGLCKLLTKMLAKDDRRKTGIAVCVLSVSTGLKRE